MTETTVETSIDRKIIVTNHGKGKLVDLDVLDTALIPDTSKRVYSLLEPEEAEKIGLALLGDNATVLIDLPEAEVDPSFHHGTPVVRSGGSIEYVTTDPAKIIKRAKELLAIAAFNTKHNAEKAEAEAKAAEEAKAKEAARKARRDELARELAEGDPYATYDSRLTVVKKAIDLIIELEEAAQVS